MHPHTSEAHKDPNSNRRLPLLYTALAYALTWGIWIPMLLIASRESYTLPVPPAYADLLRDGFRDARHAAIALVFAAAVYGPLIAALVATAVEDGKAGLVDLWQRITRWRVSIKWIGAAILVNGIIFAVPLSIGLLTGMLSGTELRLVSLPFITVAFGLQLLTSGLGEEPGWRGYLWPKLQAQQGTDKAIWTVGLLWAVWHYPFTIYFTLNGMPPGPAAAVVTTIVMALAGQTLSLVGMTTLYAWLYNNTRSVALAIFFHALSNVMPLIVAGAYHPALSLITALMPWVVVFALERLLGRARLLSPETRYTHT